jgi:hypothetical protein
MIFTSTHALRLSYQDFFGFNDPDYLTVFVEFAEERDPIAKIIGNAICQGVLPEDTFGEMIAMQLGYAGFDFEGGSDVLATITRFIRRRAQACQRYMPVGTIPTFVDAFEDVDSVFLFFKIYTVGNPWIQSSTQSITGLGSLGYLN